MTYSGGGAVLFAQEAQEVLAGLLFLLAALIMQGRINHGQIEDETETGKENE